MIKPSDIIRATGSEPLIPMNPKTNPLGLGHILSVGRIFKCAGVPGTDLDGNPIITNQHILMTLLEVPDDGKDAGVVPTERADEAKWELDSAQETIDASAPVCQVCGQPPTA